MLTDLPLAELEKYTSTQQSPPDFDDFWARTLAESRSFDLNLRVVEVTTPRLHGIRLFDVTFAGYRGQRVKAWLRLPRNAARPLPAVIQYVGYGGGRGHAFESLLWAAAGYAHLHMDTRGQGSSWSVGDTADDAAAGPQVPGFMTRGIQDKETYYYRRLMTDAVRVIDTAHAIDAIDSERIVILGGSQGGGLALAVAGLVPDIAAVFARVPFLSDFPRAIAITDNLPYVEISRYLATHRHEIETVAHTLSYFDCVNFAKRSTSPAWFSVGLMDATSPPSTVFAAYNAYRGPKTMSIWSHNGHEAGAGDDDLITLDVLSQLFS